MRIKTLAARFYYVCSLFAAMIFFTACSDKAPPVPLSAEQQLMQAGSQKARMCAGCHGPKGISRVASYPSIAGLSEAYISEQLQAFRTGQRQNPMMGSVAQNLSDADIDALSHYFAKLPAPHASSRTVDEQAVAVNDQSYNQSYKEPGRKEPSNKEPSIKEKVTYD